MPRERFKYNRAFNVEKLIIEVQKYPNLYDPEHSLYRDVEKTNNIWGTIGSVLHASGPECKMKWKNIRDSYVKKKKLLKIRSGEAAARVKTWKYLQLMSFIDAYVRERNPTSNMAVDESDEEETKSSSDSDEDMNEGSDKDSIVGILVGNPSSVTEKSNSINSSSDPSPSVISPVSSTTTPIWKPKRRMTRERRETKLETIGQMMINSIKQETPRYETSAEGPAPDEDELFMMSQLSVLRRLPPAQKALAKLQIHEILFNAEINLYEAQN